MFQRLQTQTACLAQSDLDLCCPRQPLITHMAWKGSTVTMYSNGRKKKKKKGHDGPGSLT